MPTTTPRPYHVSHVSLYKGEQRASGVFARDGVIVSMDHVVDDFKDDKWDVFGPDHAHIGVGRWVARDRNRLLAAMCIDMPVPADVAFRPSRIGDSLGPTSYVSIRFAGQRKIAIYRIAENTRCETERWIGGEDKHPISPVVVGNSMIYSGDSGSPVYDQDGKIVGLIEGGNFIDEIWAVNAHEVMDFLDSL